MDLYSQPTWPNVGNLSIKQKLIHWATRERLNNHCSNNDLLGMNSNWFFVTLKSRLGPLYWNHVSYIWQYWNHVSYVYFNEIMKFIFYELIWPLIPS